jgi:thiamine transport system substrate-binding protein
MRLLALLLALLLVAAACGDADEAPTAEAPGRLDPNEVAEADTTGVTVTLVTHDSFAVSDGVFDEFTAETGITVELSSAGDAGELVARAVLTAGAPEGDVLFGIDNTFLQRGLDGGIFLAYESPRLADVPAALRIDPEHRVTPIDYGDVCVNWWTDALPAGGPPASLEDLADPAYASTFVTQNPESSSPGFAFLLATIDRFGEDGWEDYWQRLADGGLTVTSGWSDAYFGEFVAGGGDRALVTSYASSPVAEVVFAEEPLDQPPTGVLTDGCFRQIEFAGILAGTDHPEASAKLVDFLLSPAFQEDIPFNMFVLPANSRAEVPEEFRRWSVDVAEPVTMDPATIEANRAAWTDRWVEIVLR